MLFTIKAIQEEAKATWKEPKKESAMIAATIGNRLVLPTTKFTIWAALILFILNSRMRYTIKFPIIAVLASEDPVTIPIYSTTSKINNHL